MKLVKVLVTMAIFSQVSLPSLDPSLEESFPSAEEMLLTGLFFFFFFFVFFLPFPAGTGGFLGLDETPKEQE